MDNNLEKTQEELDEFEKKIFIESIINFISYVEQIINVFLKKKKLIVIGFIISVIIGFGLAFSVNLKYTSRAIIIPPPADTLTLYSTDKLTESLSGAPLSLKSGAFNIGEDPNEMYISMLKSRTIREDIIKKYDLFKYFKVKYIEDALDSMDKMTDFESKSSLITINITTKDPELSYNVAKDHVEKLSTLISDLNMKSIKAEKEFIEKRLEKVHLELTQASKRLTNFQAGNRMIDLDKQGEAIINTISSLQGQIIAAEAELNGLKTLYTDNSSKVKSVEARISNLKNELNQLKGKKSSVKQKPATLDIKITDIPEHTIDYVELTRDVKILEQVFELLTKQYEVTKIQEAKESLILKIIENPKIPTKKSSPKRSVIFIVVVCIGLFLTFAYITGEFALNKLNEVSPNAYKKIMEIKDNIISEMFFWKKQKQNA